MDFFQPIFTITRIFGFFSLLLFLYCLVRILKISKKNCGDRKIEAPKAPGAWPVIGHLHLLGGGDKLLHRTLSSMADKCGPIFTIKLGVHQALVVSDKEIAKEIFTTNDKAFASRPITTASEIMGPTMFALSPYGPYWRHVRSIVMLELLSNRRIEILNHIRVAEVKAFVKEMFEVWKKETSTSSTDRRVKMEMKHRFGNLTMSIVLRMLVGKRFGSNNVEESCRSERIITEFLELLSLFVVSDAIPMLRWLDLGGHGRRMKRIAKEMDSVSETWLQDHKRKRRDGQDFMDVMLSTLQDDSSQKYKENNHLPPSCFDSDTIIKSTCLALLVGGSETSTVTLIWALSLLLNHRRVLMKAQEELDTHVGRERQVEASDIENLVYLQAIVKETMRLYPAGPLLFPHQSTEDCTVSGYHIPKGTYLLMNVWKIQRDPTVWTDPSEFRPERFLSGDSKDVDAKGQHFQLLPFGSGRRICPGISLALQMLHFTLAALMQGFDFSTPSEEEAIDMSEAFGIAVLKTTPLDVLVSPRLSSNLY